LVGEDKIDDAVLRIVRTLLAFDADKPVKGDTAALACRDHVALALQSAREGITLIKNSNSNLPLEREKVNRILVTGKLAMLEPIGDHGSSWVRPPYVVSPYQGLVSKAPDCEFIYDDGSDLNKTRELAAAVDAVIFCVGYDHNDEGEFVSAEEAEGYTGSMGGDRRFSLGLHKEEIALIKEVGPVNENSTVVMYGGNMIMISEWMDRVSSIIMAYYPGMEGGRALAEILFGDTAPSGKLPFVLPYRESDLPHVDWDTTSQFYDYYHGYARLEKKGIEPLFPYGFGLTYTDFNFNDASFDKKADKVTAVCTVSNNGSCEGTEIVQMYVGFKKSAVDRPVRLLRAFERVSLQPGESKEVKLGCDLSKLCYYDEKSSQMIFEKMEYEVYIGNCCSDKHLLAGTVDLS
ncbi:MAG: glycoside hydrolase family 3 C-terminal domain-containing protein, partial [Spirochaetes bacterium]|nr:glycoside hydrolase family 3 C-terminal domain-containing protein [Spirochaetota bacterium]